MAHFIAKIKQLEIMNTFKYKQINYGKIDWARRDYKKEIRLLEVLSSLNDKIIEVEGALELICGFYLFKFE